jgi:hypothetical protein
MNDMTKTNDKRQTKFKVDERKTTPKVEIKEKKHHRNSLPQQRQTTTTSAI